MAWAYARTQEECLHEFSDILQEMHMAGECYAICWCKHCGYEPVKRVKIEKKDARCLGDVLHGSMVTEKHLGSERMLRECHGGYIN